LKGQKPKVNLARIKLLIRNLDLCNEFIRVYGIAMSSLSGLKRPEKGKVKMVCVGRLSRLSFQFDFPVAFLLLPLQQNMDVGWCTILLDNNVPVAIWPFLFDSTMNHLFHHELAVFLFV
jgi:hypothetical protein